eukprot:CAMPEP_0116576668 /NCGR_PEP_ID=MMETSP0397-20121206/20664_1 /TAXON_ID=216820 /ORGANISM="Cyclophora tenuis, Strain ECT3854" /LENGTH=115 /DNA_ID=CAMNT_0004105743 /DNA_START=169 /DNA_END=513 /DNA_ORIENTATION=-
MPSSVREQMLRSAGYSRGEIQVATKHANIARARRKRTEELMNLSNLQEMTEKLKRSTMNAVVRRGRKKKEREYIKKALEVHNMKAESMEKAAETMHRLRGSPKSASKSVDTTSSD